jgi:hypothetical protein
MIVHWSETARSQLAKLWMEADSVQRRAILAAAHAVDNCLAGDPSYEGESRPGGLRVYFEAPLGIFYQVEQYRSAVTVVSVWLFHRRS